MKIDDIDDLAGTIVGVYQEVMKQILLLGQSSLSPAPYEAFKKLTMDAFGKVGARGKIKKILEGTLQD